MAFLIGQERRRPMAFSLLDVQFFANFGKLLVSKTINRTYSDTAWQLIDDYLQEQSFLKLHVCIAL